MLPLRIVGFGGRVDVLAAAARRRGDCAVSRRFYNHYSWLRTMEDLFGVAARSRGPDGQGHLGYTAPARPGSVWPRRVQQPARRASRPPAGHPTLVGYCPPAPHTRDSRSRVTPSRCYSHTLGRSRRQSAPPCRSHACSARRRAPRARSRSRSRPPPAQCRSAARRSRSWTSTGPQTAPTQ